MPEGENIGQGINDGMWAIEAETSDLEDVLPKTYNRVENATLVELLKLMGSIPMDIEGDAFGRIYEYFLGKFAMTEGRKGRPVLHSHQYRQAHRRDHRAFPRAYFRPALWLRWYVRPVRPVCAGAQG